MENKKKYIYNNQSSLWGEPEVIGFGTDDFYIKEIDRKKANEVIIKNHYSRKTYAGTFINLGIFIKDELNGVLQYGRLKNPASYKKLIKNSTIDSVLDLNRMWITDDAGKYPESRAISCSIKFIKKKYPLTKIIQSFADERCGGFGIVYQACSFKYYGEHLTKFYELEGEVFHELAVNNKGNGSRKITKREQWLKDNLHKAECYELRQFRYIKILSKRFNKEVLLKEQPYPKHYL